MSNNVRATLDLLKSQAINVIARNTTIKFPQIKKKLSEYTNSGGSYFNTLIRFVDFRNSVLSSSTISAVYLLAYLDFFALYTILFANYSVFSKLLEISNSKYEYIYSIYKQLSVDIRQKDILQKYAYCIYENFIFSKNIDWDLSGFLSRDKSTSKPLSNQIVLTLPIYEQRKISPSSITFVDIDNSNNFSDSTKYDSGFDFSLYRLQSSKIGIAEGNKAVGFGGSVKYGPDPEVTGTIYGYFADNIYVTVMDIDKDEDGVIEKIKLKSSTNGYDWSDDYEIDPGVRSNILIEDNAEIGLKILLQDGFNLTVGDKWIIRIINAHIDNPLLNVKFSFDLLEQMSFIRYTDVSRHPIHIEDAYIDRNKFGNDIVTDVQSYDSKIGHIVVSNGTVDEYSAQFIQKDYDINTADGKLAYEYEFKIRDIEGFINKYNPHGTAVINGIDVEKINTITISANDAIPKYPTHKEDAAFSPKCIIEYNVIIENDTGRIMLPMLDKEIFIKNSSNPENNFPFHLWDYIIPDTISENNGQTDYWGTAYYKPRFPVDITAPIYVYQMFDNFAMDAEYVADYNVFVIADYIYTQSASAWYKIKVNKIEDIIAIEPNSKWLKASATIFYMYFIDEYSHVHLAIREYSPVTRMFSPFTGKVYGHIEMRSMDQPYITPMVFDYSISCI